MWDLNLYILLSLAPKEKPWEYTQFFCLLLYGLSYLLVDMMLIYVFSEIFIKCYCMTQALQSWVHVACVAHVI